MQFIVRRYRTALSRKWAFYALFMSMNFASTPLFCKLQCFVHEPCDLVQVPIEICQPARRDPRNCSTSLPARTPVRIINSKAYVSLPPAFAHAYTLLRFRNPIDDKHETYTQTQRSLQYRSSSWITSVRCASLLSTTSSAPSCLIFISVPIIITNDEVYAFLVSLSIYVEHRKQLTL